MGEDTFFIPSPPLPFFVLFVPSSSFFAAVGGTDNGTAVSADPLVDGRADPNGGEVNRRARFDVPPTVGLEEDKVMSSAS